jgi:hypothetical protein
MAWEPASRVQLDKLRRQGVVAVRYEAHGCDVSLEPVPGCIGPKNRYVYAPYKSTETKILHDASELFAQLPLGAANVSSLLDGRHAIRADVKLVGSVALPAGSTITEYDLVGPECKRATHVIRAIYVGGFAMAADDAARINTTNLFASANPIEGMTREGHPRICERAEAEGIELAGCAVPLRVALLPLDGGATTSPLARKAAPSRCPSGSFFDGQRCSREVVDAGACAVGDSADAASCAPNGETAGEPRVFDQNAVERVVRENQAAVKRKCWESASDGVRRVTISVTATVDPHGEVVRADAELVDSDGSADVAAYVAKCIAGEVRTWQFPEPEKQKVLTLPFHLIRQ